MGTGKMQSQGMEIHSRDRVNGLTREGILEVLQDGSFQVLSRKEVQERQAGAERPSSTAGESPPLVLSAGFRKSAQGDGRAGRGAFSRRGFLKTVGFGGAALAAGQEKSEGILMDPGTPDSDYLALGAQCALKPGRPLFFRGFHSVFGEVKYGTALFWNERFALTAGHVAYGMDPADPATKIFTGIDLLASTGQTIRIARKILFPGYVYDSYAGPDIAILEFTEPVQGFQSAEIGSVNFGQIATGAGYGRPARPGGYLSDGDHFKLRGFQAQLRDYRPQGYPSDVYASHIFEIGNHLGAKAIGGDSGSPTYDSGGKVVGVNVYQTGGELAQGGSTIFVKLEAPPVREWLIQNTSLESPAAPLLTLKIEGNQFCVKAPWPEVANLSPAGKWQVQESPDLSAWGTALDFVQEGAFGVVRRPLGQRAYFRLRWKPD